MRIIHVVLAGWFLITVSNNCFGNDWRGIVPLKSSRADVERLLGQPTGPLPTYYLSDNTVAFWYSHCRCGDKCKDDGWNVPVDTVVSIRVDLKGVVRLADLGLDLTQFKKLPGDDDVPASFVYSNAEEGLAIEGGGEYASALIYGPRLKDNHLRCPHRSSEPLNRKSYYQRRFRSNCRFNSSVFMAGQLNATSHDVAGNITHYTEFPSLKCVYDANGRQTEVNALDNAACKLPFTIAQDRDRRNPRRRLKLKLGSGLTLSFRYSMTTQTMARASLRDAQTCRAPPATM